MNIYNLWVYLYTLLKVFIYEFFYPGLRYCYSSLSVAIQVEKIMPTPNKFQLPQSLWEVSGLMGPSLIHKEMLIGPILYTSCEDKDGYSELMGVMIIISIIHCFVVCLLIQGSCSLFAFLLRYFRALVEVLITFISAGFQLSTITYSQYFIRLWISALAIVYCSKKHWIHFHLCLGQFTMIKLSNHPHNILVFFHKS